MVQLSSFTFQPIKLELMSTQNALEISNLADILKNDYDEMRGGSNLAYQYWPL